MNLDTYLEKLQSNESIFPMDQFATKKGSIGSSKGKSPDSPKKKKRKTKNVFPESINLVNYKKRVMVDLDRTIHKYSRSWNDGTIYDPPFEGAKEALEWLRNQGFQIIIFTTRASEQNAIEHNMNHTKQIRMVSEWLNKYKIPFDGITAEKIAAEFYIDDKAVHIPNGNWNVVIQKIKERSGL
ncbi:MAG: hypothetical protein PVG65_00375 [Candidatus Thorarchaeota archaeon]|jgi:hypothetical protein